MSFPETRHTLIQRLADSGQETDWHQFLHDYWGPVSRFAARRSNGSLTDAEDVASQTFEVIFQNKLLNRWLANRSAKLRTLLCSVVRRVLANRYRVQQGRARLLREQLEQGAELPGMRDLDEPADQVDAFYAAWADDLLTLAVDSLFRELHREGKGDYFRVLYGRLCDQMNMPEISQALGIKTTSAENYFKAARKRLADRLEELVRGHVARYSPQGLENEEFSAEWVRLGEYLTAHGGLEEAVRQAHQSFDGAGSSRRKESQIQQTLSRMTPGPRPEH